MEENLQPILDDLFAKANDVFCLDDFINAIDALPISEELQVFRPNTKEWRRSVAREYLLERCDYFNDSRICIKYETTSDLATNVALIHPESTLYILEGIGMFVELKEYNSKNRSISINTNNVAQINTETGGAGSRVSTIYLTNKLEP